MRKVILLLTVVGISLGCAREDAKRVAQEHANNATYAAQKGDFEEAVKHAEMAIEYRPEVPEFRVGLGRFYKKIGEDEKAKKEWERALEIYESKKEDVHSWNQKVFVLFLLDRKEEGRKAIELGRKKFPEDDGLKVYEENPNFLDDFDLWSES